MTRYGFRERLRELFGSIVRCTVRPFIVIVQHPLRGPDIEILPLHRLVMPFMMELHIRSLAILGLLTDES